jgi:GTPase SAR1 family protein
MFSLVNGVYQAYFATPQLNVLIVGAQGAGKTTLMERIKVTEFATKSPKIPHVLDRYSLQLSLEDAQEIFFRDDTVDVANLSATKGSSSNNSNSNNNNKHAVDLNSLETPTTRRQLGNAGTAMLSRSQRRFLWICPAPKRYQHDANDSDDEDSNHQEAGESSITTAENNKSVSALLPLDDVNESVSLLSSAELPEQDQDLQTPTTYSQTGSSSFTGGTKHSALEAMQSIELNDESDLQNNNNNNNNKAPQEQQQQQHYLKPPALQDYDLKKHCKMLPLSRIRPTIGMNLGKIPNICGAKCHVMDVGGRMQQLWERYYHDCDAVIFVWKIQADDNKEDDSSEREDDDSDRPDITAKQQLQLLEQVRGSISEDVPFLVLGQVSSVPSSNVQFDRLYSSSCLLPSYHNVYQSLFFANAATGQGVRSAFEWLIPLAKRQQLSRVKVVPDEEKL